MSWHPCDHYSCSENNGGQCYGDGCDINPMLNLVTCDEREADDFEDYEEGDK